MLSKILNWFTRPSKTSDLEKFINSKNPNNVSEIDYWTKYYEQSSNWRAGL